jgi:hypothetical protein
MDAHPACCCAQKSRFRIEIRLLVTKMDTPTLLPSPYQPGGPILTERQFIGRSDTINRVLSLLEDARENVMMIEGPHQVGKTSLLHQLRRRWGVPNGAVIFSLRDFSADTDIADVLHDLGRVVMQATPTLPYGVGRNGSSAEQSACHLIDLLNQIAKHRKAQPPFVVMLDDPQALAPQDRAPKANPIRYLEMIVQQCPTTKFVIVQTLEPGAGEQPCAQIFRRARRLTLGNLTRGEVAGVCRLSERVAKTQGLRWTDEAIEAVYGLTDGHPLLVQAMCAGIWQRLARAEPSRTVEREDLEGEATLTLLLEEAGDALAQIWAKLPVAAQAVLMLVAQQGNVVAVRDLDAAIMARRRWHGVLRQACTELHYAGFLVAEGDGVRCSPPLLGLWAQRKDLSSAGELQQMIAATDQLPHARSRARTKTPPHQSAPPPI